MITFFAVFAGACVLLVFYVYVAYPCLLALASLFRPGSTRAEPGTCPSVTLIIPAYNEEVVIREKLLNSLRIDYPSDRLQIIVASDGSTDGTNEIARSFSNHGVRLLRFEPRAGKISALNRAMQHATGELVLLCDANVMFYPDAVKRLVRHFSDPTIGAVTGDVRLKSEDAPFGEGEGLYYRYERFIQECESSIGSIVGVDGGMYMIRRHLYRPLPEDTILDDFVISMNIALAGYRVVYDPSAIATENATTSTFQEFRRKVRIVAGAFRELLRGQAVPGWRQPLILWTYVSHKLLRWVLPWVLLGLLVSSCTIAVLAPSPITIGFFAIQAAFYALAAIGLLAPDRRWPALVGIPFYFCMVNAAALVGSVRGLFNVERVTWQKADR